MARNPALETKVRALKGKLLTDRDYLRIIDSTNVSEVIAYLRSNTQFKAYLSNISDDVSRTILEEQFNHVVIDNSHKILYFIHSDESDFIQMVVERINLASILIVIRAIAKQEDLREILSALPFSKIFSQINFDNVIESKSWESLKDALRNTNFYRSIENYNELTPQNLFEIERTLQRSYYDLVFRTITELNSKGNKNLIKCIRTEIDLLNLIWIYRAKKFYHYNVEEIIPFIYRGGLRINEDMLKRLAQIDSFEELLEELKKFKEYSFLFDHPENDLDLHMNRRRKRYMYYQYKELFFFGNGISSAYAYLQLLDYEISDIISIIEAKRYRLTNEETIKYLIRNISH